MTREQILSVLNAYPDYSIEVQTFGISGKESVGEIRVDLATKTLVFMGSYYVDFIKRNGRC
jgi:hypothetical protein